MRSLLLLLSILTLSAADKKVRWYVNEGDVAANVQFARENPSALTGWYGCCNLFSVDGEGSASARENLTDKVFAMKHAISGRNLTYHAVFSVNESAIHSGKALDAVDELTTMAKFAGVDGLLCDYEPSDNYTNAHAESYAEFLESLASSLQKEHMELGFDVAGWGILQNFAVYAPLKVDFYTSMSPTYNDKNASLDRDFSLKLFRAVGQDRAAIGIGSIPAEGHEESCSNMPAYLWTNDTLIGFLGYLQKDAGIRDVDVWRCDIDHYGETAPWFVAAIARFLSGNA